MAATWTNFRASKFRRRSRREAAVCVVSETLQRQWVHESSGADLTRTRKRGSDNYQYPRRAATSGPACYTSLFALRPSINRTGFGDAIINVRERKRWRSDKRSKMEKENERRWGKRAEGKRTREKEEGRSEERGRKMKEIDDNSLLSWDIEKW